MTSLIGGTETESRNEQTRQTNKNSSTQTTLWCLPEGKRGGGVTKAGAGQIMVTDGDGTLGGKLDA